MSVLSTFKMLHLILILLLSHSTIAISKARLSKMCPRVNGVRKACLLHYSQFTFAGSHNSGSYGNTKTRILGLNTPPGGRAFAMCYLENQSLSIEEQLDIGVRAFDFDVAYERGTSKGVKRGAVITHCSKGRAVCGYNGRLKDALQDIAKFIKNKHEVIIIRIKDHHVRNREERVLLAHQIAQDFRSTIRFRRINYHLDPYLGIAILQQRTVFIYLHTKLYIALKYLPFNLRRFMIYARPHKVIESWYKMHKTLRLGCDLKKDTLKFLSDPKRAEFMAEHPWVPIVVDWYSTSKLVCNKDGAGKCSRTVADSIPISAFLRAEYNRTINVLLTDYTTIQAVNVVKIINQKNVRYFSNVQTGYNGHDYHWRHYPFRTRRKNKVQKEAKRKEVNKRSKSMKTFVDKIR